MGEVVSLTIQLSAAGAGADDAVEGGGGAMLRESFSRHSSRSACASSEQARSFSIASLAPCASASALASPNIQFRQIVAIFILFSAACAPGDPAIPESPGSGGG